MDKKLSRRDFLRLSGVLSLTFGGPYLKLLPSGQADTTGKKNVLIIVFDAFSARHISTYGYERETTPNIARLADRAIVYHNHHASGNYTTPGTASLLTGTFPWTHRAFDMNHAVANDMSDKSLFHAFHDYFRVAYSHNPYVVTFLNQFSPDLDENIPRSRFFINSEVVGEKVFTRDEDIASVAWARYIKKINEVSYSLFLSSIYQQYRENSVNSLIRTEFPRGLPNFSEDLYFTLEMVMDWLGSQVNEFPRPFLGYFHFLPPHYPYNTRREFVNTFKDDGFLPPEKEKDIFTDGKGWRAMLTSRQQYDEYILYVDREFGKLFQRLEDAGMLEDTWVVLTSDHGELHERGYIGHNGPLLYEPIIHIPLLIFEPERSARTDVYTYTSAVDVLPTLLSVTGGRSVEWTEGLVLPPFSNEILTSNRGIYSVQTKDVDPNAPLAQRLTLMQIKDNYKLMYFTGYKKLLGKERVELYNLAEDPEELNNLFSDQSDIGKTMLGELMSKLFEVNKPYS